MDTLTHGLTGALLGRALSNNVKKLKPRTFILIGAFAAVFPDFDFLFILKSKAVYLEFHRSITHSLFLLPIWALLISMFFSWLLRNKILLHKNWVDENTTNKEILRETYFLSCFSILSHILSDLITSYGTMFLSPVFNTRFSTGSMHLIDFWFSGTVLTGLLASWFIKKDSYLMARTFFLVLLGYVFLTQHIKYDAEQYALLSLKAVHSDPSKLTIHSVPMAFSPYNWSISAYDAEEELYYTSQFNLKEAKILRNNVWQAIPRWGKYKNEHNSVKKAWLDPEFSMFRWFMTIPTLHSITKKDNQTCIYFQDLKFSSPDRDNPVVYGLCESTNGDKYRSHLVNTVDNPL